MTFLLAVHQLRAFSQGASRHCSLKEGGLPPPYGTWWGTLQPNPPKNNLKALRALKHGKEMCR